MLSELLVFRPLRTSSPLAKLVASLGILLILQATVLLWFGSAVEADPEHLPDQHRRRCSARRSRSNRFWMAGIVVLIALALGALYRWTRFGLATRAASENEVFGMLAGLSPNQLSMANTVLASALAGAMGIVAAPLAQADSSTLVLFIVPALAAALFAGFTSLGIACLAGFGVGIGQSLMSLRLDAVVVPDRQGATRYRACRRCSPSCCSCSRCRCAARSLPTRGELVEKRLPVGAPAAAAGAPGRRAGRRRRRAADRAAVRLPPGADAVAHRDGRVPLAGGDHRLRRPGVARPGHARRRVRVRRCRTCSSHAGIGFPWGPLAGSVAGVVVGLIVGASALRVRGASLAVVTLAGVVAIEQFGFANSRWGAGPERLPGRAADAVRVRHRRATPAFRGLDGKVPSPVLGFVFLVVVIALCLLVANLRRSVLGQQMLAVRANERAAAAAGINVARVKITAYAISSFIAGTAGWMYAYNFGSVSSARFGFLIALGFVAFAYIGGITMVSGAVDRWAGRHRGSRALLLPDDLLGISGNWTLLVGGLLLIVTLIQNPDGVAGTTYRKRQAAKRAKAAAEQGQARGAPDASTTAGSGHERGDRMTQRARRPRHLGLVRRRARRGRRRSRRRARPAGRPDRPERRRQDDVHRRHHRVRAASRHDRARR